MSQERRGGRRPSQRESKKESIVPGAIIGYGDKEDGKDNVHSVKINSPKEYVVYDKEGLVREKIIRQGEAEIPGTNNPREIMSVHDHGGEATFTVGSEDEKREIQEEKERQKRIEEWQELERNRTYIPHSGDSARENVVGQAGGEVTNEVVVLEKAEQMKRKIIRALNQIFSKTSRKF